MAKLFFSYSHKDEELRNELEVHLAMLKRQGLISTWHDRRIGAGDNIHSSIGQEIEEADVILLLVSASFLSSDYCYNQEMSKALKRHNDGTAKVIPIILHPCDWHGAPFGDLRASPPDGKAVSMFANQAEALSLISQDIRKAVENLSPEVLEEDKYDHDSVCEDSLSSPQARSSNLRVKRQFSDQEVDEYMESTFKYISRFFTASLDELQKRNQNITAKFKKVDANCFTASIYDDGARVSECTIWMGSDGMFGGGISYFSGITSSRNQFNDMLNVHNDGYSLHLRPSGFSSMDIDRSEQLAQEGAAEYLWGLLIDRLQ